MELSWGHDLWDRLDDIINHTNLASNFIDKFQKCLLDCHQVWNKAYHKQKRLLEKLNGEIKDSAYTEFTMTTGLMSIISNVMSIYSIKSTFANSVATANEDILKKVHSQIKKISSDWINEKRKMEDSLSKQRKKYDSSLKRYRDKYQAVLLAQDNLKKSEENKSLSRAQLDTIQQAVHERRDDFDFSKRDYAVELRDFNKTQMDHFDEKVPAWAKKGEELYNKKLNLIKEFSTSCSKLTSDMIIKLNYSVNRFADISSQVNFTKDMTLLIQKFKTGDVPPLELQFIDMDYREHSSKSAAKDRETSEDSSSASELTSSNDSIDNRAPMKTQAHRHSNSSLFTTLSHESRSDPIRSTTQTTKNRNQTATGVVNPEAKFSMQKSSKIFKSSTPWKNSVSNNNAAPVKQPSLYQRRGRNSTRQMPNTRRSRSVTDMISDVFRSSLRLKGGDDKHSRKTGVRDRSPSQSQIETSRQSISDFDSDTEDNPKRIDVYHYAPDIVSTPAEAVAAFNRQSSVPDIKVAEQLYLTMHRPDSPSSPKSQSSQQDEPYQYFYVGSCVSNHSFEIDDPSNSYLSFKAGDQFYILKTDEGSGWLYVETVDRSAQGYVPSSYMKILLYDDNLSEAVV